VKIYVGKLGITDFLHLLDLLNRLFSIFLLKVKVEVFSYKSLSDLFLITPSRVSLVVFSVIIIESVSKVLRGLINLLVFDDSQELLSFSFNPIKFIPDISFEIPKVFQEDVPLLGVLFL